MELRMVGCFSRGIHIASAAPTRLSMFSCGLRRKLCIAPLELACIMLLLDVRCSKGNEISHWSYENKHFILTVTTWN